RAFADRERILIFLRIFNYIINGQCHLSYLSMETIVFRARRIAANADKYPDQNLQLMTASAR
ncbi:MAG: hypothetical protein VX639_10080, partial [Pseudomonadota bacterium]|nr:hypothetical protein [Pseudomonadota bacterium]